MAARLDYLRRLLGTAFGFAFFGVAGVCMKILLLPYILRPTDGDLVRQKQARRLVMASWRMFGRYLVWAGIVSVEFRGLEKLGRSGQWVLANHPSLLDVVFLLAQMPEANCIVKADLLKNPAMNSQIRACGFVPNEESLEFADTVHNILQEQCLLLFPEGTRTGWDGVVQFHRGAVALGLRSAKVITPVRISVNPPNFKKGQPWYRIPPQKVHYLFEVGEDILPQTWLAEKPLPIAARRLNEHLQNHFNERTQHV